MEERMITDHLWRRASLHKAALILATASVLVMAAAAPAMATPKGDFAVFSQCPTKNPEVFFCYYGTSTGGEFQIKTTKVPIKATVTLQGGSIINEETGAETFVEAANGVTLSKTPEQVPGGLLGVI